MTNVDNDFSKSHLPFYSLYSGTGQEVTSDLYQFTNQIVNLFFYGDPYSTDWVLIDAGMPHGKEKIMAEAASRMGHQKEPKAIILTHGHFDHVGALEPLLEVWEVPVYAHALEIPYLTGKENYPKGDSTVHGGLVSALSPLFPNHGIDISSSIQPLSETGVIPYMPGWQWIHTPGHTPGHISLYREQDGTLIAGDAFVTVKQESLYKVVTQKKEISGPPKYFTQDWHAARLSVEKLAKLQPNIAVTGHGLPMEGTELHSSLKHLVDNFDEIALPGTKRNH
ncbi:putative metallo-hydrolase YflN [Paraliobacillus ryukyuensis]|uniref:Glyoxylase-like metal-dependent hydrolase (Beta-lactamase superfamily II) n=1 Tax=Paraliobacillus ryukyuensis TaxID=200904 RepID=A0A366E498_9BACI|nr:MBL fold metallo-hydrolase [Paraliobacillus ryukyuensis]RBO97142.1 glyoxylase-like metal-dependent hydrolase (beta-lactamase superfamily II) [Paraliobacillus ryukyuensis]